MAHRRKSVSWVFISVAQVGCQHGAPLASREARLREGSGCGGTADRREPRVGVCVSLGNSERGTPDKRIAPFAFQPSVAHDVAMGQSCERCGRPGKPCSIRDPRISGKWKTLILCDQCQAAIRQTDARACRWLRRYCAPRKLTTPILRAAH